MSYHTIDKSADNQRIGNPNRRSFIRFFKNNIGLLCLLFLLGLFFTGCEKEDEVPQETQLPDLDEYLERFEAEAAKRGYDFDLSAIQTVYRNKIEVGDVPYCGYGYWSYQGTGQRRIEISESGICNWKNISDIERENLFFHEIGHAFFNRSHDESKLCDGSPLSIMTSTTSNWKVYSAAETEKRDYYISELIDRMAALDQCIDYEKELVNDSIFYRYGLEDEWVFDSRDGYYRGNTIAANDSMTNAITIEAIPGIETDKGGRWYRRINNPNVQECADLTLKVTMNSDMLTGAGAAISIRAFHTPVGNRGAQSEEYLYVTTTEHPVSGKLDKYVEELTIPCYSRKTTFIVLFLRLMGNTKGKVTFEDIQLVVRE